MPVPYGIAGLLNDIIEEGKRPRTQREDEANNAFVLGVGSIKDLVEAKRHIPIRLEQVPQPSREAAGHGWRPLA